MKISLRSATSASSIVTLVASLAVSLAMPLAAKAAGTPAGTSIVNQATSTYNDTAGNGYVSVSNRVTTVVQNAPSVTFTAGTLQATVPGGQLTDTFTLTNTGNAAAYFTLANAGTTGTDGASQTIAAYEVTLPAAYVGTLPAGCTELGSTFTYSCTTLGTSGTGGSGANLLLYNTTEAPGTVVTIGVVYNVAAGAAAGTIGAPNTIVTNLTASATQAAGTGTLVTTSTALASADTDDVVTDARVDVQKYGVQPNTAAVGDMPANTTANIEYQITSANGGSVPVRDLASVKTLLGSGANGVFFSDKIPSFTPNGSSTATLAAIQSAAVTTSTTNGFGANSSATIYYQTQGSTTWTAYTIGAFPANVTYIGVLVSGTPLAEYGTNNNGTSQGVVPTAKSAVTLTFYVSPPSGTGSGNANAYFNSVDAVSGGDQPNLNPDSAVSNPAQNVVGPGVATGTADSTTAIDSGAQGILYPTGTSVSASSAINESNTVGNQASITGSVLNGPFGVPGAVGSYNGVVAASNNNDNTATAFTPIGFVPANSGTSPPATASAPSGNQLGAAATITVPNTLQNIGNSADSITVNVAAPAGFTAQIFAASVLGIPIGVSLSGAAANTATYTFPLVPSGGTGDVLNQVSYAVTYTVPATGDGLHAVRRGAHGDVR